MRSKTKLLIVEHDLALLTQLRWHLDQYEVLGANHREQAVAEVRRHEPALVILDPDLGEAQGGLEEGLRCIRELTDLTPSAKIIVISNQTPPALAMRLLDLGVHDIFEKPAVAEILEVVLQRAAYLSELEQQRRKLAQYSTSQLPGFVSQDPVVVQLTARGLALAKQRQPCLVEGQVGNGCNRFAEAMHQVAFKKRSADCLQFDLATQWPALWDVIQAKESERRTLICRNIEQLNPTAQSQLHKALIAQLAAPVSIRHLWIALRHTPSQHASLDEQLRNVFEQERLRLPALKERKQDIALLARFFLSQYRRLNPNVKSFHANAIEAIESHQWDTISELENTLKEGLRVCKTRLLSAEDIGLSRKGEGELNLRKVRDKAEKQALMRALTAANGNVSKAALLLGITRPTLYDLVKKLQIKVPTAADIRRYGKSPSN